MSIDAFMRKIVFSFAENHWVSGLFRKYGMRIGVSRFVAAETLEETVRKVGELNNQKLLATLDFLGESVVHRGLAEEATDTIIGLYAEIDRCRLKSNISVKLTQVGLHMDTALCLRNMDRIAAAAKRHGNFVRIDMEDSAVTETTLVLCKMLMKKYGKEHVGIVIQSYLYRSLDDMTELSGLGTNVRFVKGAYKEPAEVAFPNKKDVDTNYIRLVKNHLLSGGYAAIATHDESIINEIKRFVSERGITADCFEFQMLYGISGSLQRQLAEEGYRVRVYTPFGKHWYPYFTRRIAERPANLWFVLKGLLRK